MKLKKHVEDVQMRPIALDVLNRLKAGDRVFGSPAQGLKQTLKKMEDRLEKMEREKDALDYLDKSGDIRSEIAMLKAGIAGEENLAEFMERMIKTDLDLQDLIVFASLSDPEQNSGGDEYISDSDFIVIYGNHALIIDAKNIRTNPEMPIYIEDNVLISASGVEMLEIHPSVNVWKKIFKKYGVEIDSVHGCTVIVNDRGALIWRNPAWYNSEAKPLHISELVEFLHKWIEDKENTSYLNTLAVIANMQIKEDTGGMDFSYAKRMFNM